MGSSKFEFETYKTKRFKTNKLGEREYIVGCVPYKISPLVCHREDAVRKEHSVFLLVLQQISRRQHGPPLTAMCKVRAILFNLTVVPSYQFMRWLVAWLIPMLDKGSIGTVSPLQVLCKLMLVPSRTYASQYPLAPSLTCEIVGRGRIRKWTRK